MVKRLFSFSHEKEEGNDSTLTLKDNWPLRRPMAVVDDDAGQVNSSGRH